MSSSVYQIDPEIIASKNNDGSIVAMKADDSDLFYKITGVATDVWDLMEKKMDIEAIIEQIASEYDVSKKQVENDVNNFINDLKKLNILKMG
ncbi:MAG: PqqD family protein [Bacteriovoracaceae bacterium]|jgi:DNA-binding NtrC family response regulator|nr:PqqD family protein [Bacteriovoracaceae bacterium]|tara:strand:+ start:299 stop:574 length:276 start_codon:yes stop_codon:yes gene_type:complete